MRYGGHVAAAGMTLRLNDFEAFKDRFESGVKTLMTDDVGVQPLEYDIELPLNEFTRELYDELRRVGPFGHANPAPKIFTQGIRAVHRILRGGHLKLLIRTQAGEIEGWHGIEPTMLSCLTDQWTWCTRRTLRSGVDARKWSFVSKECVLQKVGNEKKTAADGA